MDRMSGGGAGWGRRLPPKRPSPSYWPHRRGFAVPYPDSSRTRAPTLPNGGVMGPGPVRRRAPRLITSDQQAAGGLKQPAFSAVDAANFSLRP